MRCTFLIVTSMAFAACNLDHSLGALESDAGGNPGGPDAGTAPSADTAPSTQPGNPNPGSPNPVPTPDPTAQDPSVALQSWSGYIENYTFPSGSDSIKFSFAVDGAGQITGTVVFGNGIAPPPATDPNVGYPPGYPSTVSPYEGATYTITSGSFQSNRLRFTIDYRELWAGWCAIQPAPVDGSTMCIPYGSYSMGNGNGPCTVNSPSGEVLLTIDCTKMDLCFLSMTCACSPNGCVLNEEATQKVSFDVFLSNGTGSGSMSESGFSSHNLHVTQNQ